MSLEIERKFLVKNDKSVWMHDITDAKIVPKHIVQNYIALDGSCSVRVRVINNNTAKITVKHKTEDVTVRSEFEYNIPINDAIELLRLCKYTEIDKLRYVYTYKGNEWSIDFFHGDNEGLIIAEIELPSADFVFEKPDWVDREVTSETKFFNENLCVKPFSLWCVD